MSLYRVIGPVKYRGHEPGDVFEAVLDSATERRAVARGNIELVEQSKPALRPGSYRRGWRSSG